MDNIQSSVEELLQSVKTIAPNCRPSIIPHGMIIESFENIFCESAAVDKWATSFRPKEVVFVSEVSYSTMTINIVEIKIVDPEDIDLYDLMKLTKALTIGNDSSVSHICDRFRYLNNYEDKIDLSEIRQKLTDLINISNAIRVLISNIPGWKLTCQNSSLPMNVENPVNVAQSLVKKSSEKHVLASKQSSQSPIQRKEEDSSSNNSDSEEEISKKKRKRRRGK